MQFSIAYISNSIYRKIDSLIISERMVGFYLWQWSENVQFLKWFTIFYHSYCVTSFQQHKYTRRYITLRVSKSIYMLFIPFFFMNFHFSLWFMLHHDSCLNINIESHCHDVSFQKKISHIVKATEYHSFIHSRLWYSLHQLEKWDIKMKALSGIRLHYVT